MWNGKKTFPLSTSTEKNLKAVLIDSQMKRNLTSSNFTVVKSKSANKISIDMDFFMQKRCVAHHST